jgi:DNA-binding response OmpR family regulator
MTAAVARRILVVDDEEDVGEVLQYLIEDEGYKVVTATTVAKAIAIASEGGFSAALIDVSIGTESGLELAQALRAAPSTATLPIVIITGLSEEAVRDQFTAYDLFVSKGEDLTHLVERLGRLIDGTSQANEGTTAEPI